MLLIFCNPHRYHSLAGNGFKTHGMFVFHIGTVVKNDPGFVQNSGIGDAILVLIPSLVNNSRVLDPVGFEHFPPDPENIIRIFSGYVKLFFNLAFSNFLAHFQFFQVIKST